MPCLSIWCAVLAITCFALPPDKAPQQYAISRSDTLKVATYDYGTLDRRGAVLPLAEMLGVALRRPVRVVTAPDPVALVDSVRAGSVHVVVTNTFGYLLLAEGANPAGTAVATFRVPPGVRTNYGAVLVSTHAAIQTLGDFSQHRSRMRVTFVSAGSTTGNLIPRLALAGAGTADVDTQSAAVAYAGTHAAAFLALRDGRADVAGLAREEFDRQIAQLPQGERARYRVLWASPDIMLGPVAVARGVNNSLRDSITAAVVGMERHAPQAFAALRGGWTEALVSDGLVAATDSSYDEVRRLFGKSAIVGDLIRRLAR